MSEISFYWVNGPEIEADVAQRFSSDPEMTATIGPATFQIGDFDGSPALIVSSDGHVGLFLVEGVWRARC